MTKKLNLMFSVIVPVYNRSKEALRAIKSVLSQSMQDFEIIVVDDGSIDYENLLSQIKLLNSNKIKLIRHDINRNGAAARNTGIRNSTGKYICFLDSDDEWGCLRLEEINTMLRTVQEDKALIYSTIMLTNKDRTYDIKPKVPKPCEMAVGDYLFINDGLMQTSGLVLPNLFENHPLFNEGYKRHQDYDYVLTLECLGYDFHYLETDQVIWNVGSRSALKMKGGCIEYYRWWISNNKPRLTDEAINAYYLKIIVPAALEEGRIIEAISTAKNSIHHAKFKVIYQCFTKSFKSLIYYLIFKK